MQLIGDSKYLLSGGSDKRVRSWGTAPASDTPVYYGTLRQSAEAKWSLPDIKCEIILEDGITIFDQKNNKRKNVKPRFIYHFSVLTYWL
jgi:hypothetical protein